MNLKTSTYRVSFLIWLEKRNFLKLTSKTVKPTKRNLQIIWIIFQNKEDYPR